MKKEEIEKKVIEYLDSISAIGMFGKKTFSQEELIEFCSAIADYFLNLKKEEK